jgi:hypothetical protein
MGLRNLLLLLSHTNTQAHIYVYLLYPTLDSADIVVPNSLDAAILLQGIMSSGAEADVELGYASMSMLHARF